MLEERHIWQTWSRALKGWGMQAFAGWLLEATAPIHIIGAQLVYIGQPLLGLFISDEHTQSLARLLEQPESARALAHYLQEEAVS
jgi:hypothetical protein